MVGLNGGCLTELYFDTGYSFLVFFVGIFYMVDSFCNYMVSSAPRKMMKAEELDAEANAALNEGDNSDDSQDAIDESTQQRVNHAVERWIQAGGYRQCGLNIPNAADEIGIPRYLLSSWLKQQGLTYATWMTDVRIDEAKRVLIQHPEWNNEAVASHCIGCQAVRCHAVIRNVLQAFYHLNS